MSDVPYLPPDPDLPPEDSEDEHPRPRVLNRWIIGGVAALLATIMIAGPIVTTIDRFTPEVADNGLLVCAYDYCEVQTAVQEAGHGSTMARLARIYLSADEAQRLANDLLDAVGGPSVRVEEVDNVGGSAIGRYDSRNRLIELERPISAWTVVHEVAHVTSTGHEALFLGALSDLIAVLDRAVDDV